MREQKSTKLPDNDEIALTLIEAADLLEAHGANPFRVRAYRRAAETVRGLGCPVRELIQAEGAARLERLPGIGRGLSRSIEQLVRTGRLASLDRLQHENTPEDLLATVPNIGPKMARRIHEQAGIEDLLDLQRAATDGRLARVEGMGEKRLRSVRESLAGRFSRWNSHVPDDNRPTTTEQVPVGEILSVDEQFRRLARQKRLPRVAPQRFNPTGDAWMPVLRVMRGERKYTALYSNTAKAHELGMTHDWVVIYRKDRGGTGLWTVITSHFGPLNGKRVVRGREDDCAEFYIANETPLFYGVPYRTI